MTRLSIDPKWYITDLSTKINSTGETALELDSHAETCVLGRDASRVMTLPLALRLMLLLAEFLHMMTL
jgi:hypothetical protein